MIELRHRTVEQVLPSLRPLLEPGGVLTGQRSQLIVRTSPRNLAELRRALEVLDAPARRLVISVRFDASAASDERVLGADGRISNRGSRVEIRGLDSSSAAGERVDQRLQVLEGGRAYLATGATRPLRLRDGVVLQEVATGFEVVPRLTGDTVLLEVSPRRESPGAMPGSVQGLRGASTVSARLGEWIELAGVTESDAREERGLASSARRSGSAGQRIWVKVEEVRP